MVIVFGPKDATDRQLDQWKDAAPDFARRSVAIFRSSEINESAEIEKKLSIPPGASVVVLVDTNGRRALRIDAPLSASSLCRLIDSIPGQQDEMLSRR